MIQIEKLSYGVPAKELYEDISFTIEEGLQYALIGSNGTGKSTLVDMIIDPEEYLFDGKITKDPTCRIGYASQFSIREKTQDCTVFEYLSEKFAENEKAIAEVCEEMALGENLEELFEKYQSLLDIQEAMGGDSYESNILKQLYTASMTELKDTALSQISGGEYKVIQIMREMLLSPNLLILDEPDVFLDFANLNSLCSLINGYKGTLLVITHNRYLLNHCFNRILHLENRKLNVYEGNYTEYRCWQMKEKLKLKRQSFEELEEIKHTEELVETLRTRATLMVNPVIGRSVNAKQSQLDRLLARHIEAPFIELREPEITLPEVEITEDKTVLNIDNYQVEYDKMLLQDVSFQLKAGEKVAIVGANGTGKTTLVRDIISGNHPCVEIDEDTEYACLSQLQGETVDNEKTAYEIMLDRGFGNEDKMRDHLIRYGLEEIDIHQPVRKLSVGEQNLLQIALIGRTTAEFLILDEPTSHLDIYAQIALEKAIGEYKGTVLMISHDFYLIANCADYVLLVEEGELRRMRARTFRKMVYDKYFDQKYLEIDRKRQEIEAGITSAYKKNDLDRAEKLCLQLEQLNL